MPAYPPFLLRLTNFRQAESAGQPISTSNMDGETNNGYAVVNEINRRLRLITDVTGKLTNIASQISQALVGTYQEAMAGGETTVTTTITWDASFSVGNVMVIANGVILSQALYSVANNGGFLEVTIPAAEAGFVVVAAFSTGAGIETRLLDTTSGSNGANMVGVQDVDAHFISATVEGALAELADSLSSLIASLGTIGDIWTKSGLSIAGDPASADWDLGGFQLKNIGDATDAQDAVSLAQLLSLTQSIQDLLSIFIRADGAVPFDSDQSMGGNKLTDLDTPTDPTDAANKDYVDTAVAGVTADSLALDGIRTTDARGRLTGPVSMEQVASATADVTQDATATVQTLFGVPRPSAADQVANKQYVDESINAALDAGSLRSPYSRRTYSLTLDGIAGIDGLVTNVAAGGAFYGTAVTVSVPQAPTQSVYIFSTGDVAINAALTMAGFDIEINAEGNVSITDDITAKNIRIFAGGTVTIGVGATLTADNNEGVVSFEGASTFTSSGDVNAALIFGYFDGIITIPAGAWRAAIYSGSAGDWNSGGTAPTRWGSRLGYTVPSTWPVLPTGTLPGEMILHAGKWGDQIGVLDTRDILQPVDPSTYPIARVKQIVPDYMTPHAGTPNADVANAVGPGWGPGIGGSGPRGGGSTAGATAPALGGYKLWGFPAAPGGGGAAGWRSNAFNLARGSGPGGVILLFTLADMVLTGTATFNADGLAGSTFPAHTAAAGGGGGGGFVKLAARGTITDGDCSADGGAQPGTSPDTAGGGVVVAVALTFAGVQAFSAAGNAAGTTLTQVLTADQWDESRLNGYLER